MDRSAPAFRPVEAAACMLCLALGLLLAWQWNAHEPWEIESALGLYPSTAPFRRAIEKSRAEWEQRQPAEISLADQLRRAALGAMSALPLVLTPVTFGLAFVTFRRPGSLGARLLRAPGIVATALAAAILSVRLLAEATARWAPFVSARIPPGPITLVPGRMGEHVGIGLLALWVVMGLGGAWRPRPHPLDRLGRFLGGAWIVYLVWKTTAYWLVVG